MDYNRGYQCPDNGGLGTPKAVTNCQMLDKETSHFKVLLNVQAPIFYPGSKHYYKRNIFAPIFLPVECRDHCQDFVGNFGCDICYFFMRIIYGY